MAQVFTATFEDGVFKPDQPPDLPAQAKVRLIVEPMADATEVDRDAAWQELERLWEEVEVDSGGERLTRDELHERH